MSEVHLEEHSSPIKTPKQLVIVVVGGLAVLLVLLYMLAQLATMSIKFDKEAMSDEAVAARLKPVGEVEVIDPAAPKVEKTGKEVVEAVCGACHGVGALGAPKIGDKSAWGRLIKEGLDSLTKTAIKGIRQMPARGGNPELSNTEVARAVAHMANQSGANFKEPEAKPAPAAKSAAAPAAAAAPAKK